MAASKEVLTDCVFLYISASEILLITKLSEKLSYLRNYCNK
jgi:hypothetical protein